VIGLATAVFVVGILVLIATGIWFAYRIVKGWTELNDAEPVGVRLQPAVIVAPTGTPPRTGSVRADWCARGTYARRRSAGLQRLPVSGASRSDSADRR